MTTITKFPLAEEDQSVLEQAARITLTVWDFARFVELIEKPKPPTPELREAMAKFRRLQATHPDANL